MGRPQSAAALAPFTEDWIGGNIRGLQNLADTLYSYPPKMNDITETLGKQASRLTSGPEAWEGSSADAFTSAWGRDSVTAQALAVVAGETGSIIDALAATLAGIESALEEQAYATAKHGVPVGPDGQPAPVPEGPPATPAGASYQQWALAYQQVHQQAMADADHARTEAASQLMSLYKQVAPQSQDRLAQASATATGNLTIAQLLADLWAVPTAYRRDTKELIEKLDKREATLEDDIEKVIKKGELPAKAVRDELTGVTGKLQDAESSSDAAGHLETTVGKLLDARLSDVSDYLRKQAGPGKHVSGRPTADDAVDVGNEEGTWLSGLLDTGEKLPVVDVAAAAAATAIGTYYDVKSGQHIYTALPDEAATSTAAIAAGTAATVEVSTVVGAAIGGVPGAIVGAAAGTVVSVGVGDLTHNLLTEPWGADIQQHGVAAGIVYGIGHAEFATGNDAKAAAVGIGHTVEHIWDGFF
jgi:uncharacterized protein YukE